MVGADYWYAQWGEQARVNQRTYNELLAEVMIDAQARANQRREQ